MNDVKVFDTRITSQATISQHTIFIASITCGGIPVFTRYYTNNPQAEMMYQVANRLVPTTRHAVYDTVEAKAGLLIDFGKFLNERWN